MRHFQALRKLLQNSPESPSGGKLAPRAPLPHFDREADALKLDETWKISLDGEWDFAFFDAPDQAVLNGPFAHRIKVPGEWDMQGFGHPWYLNVDMPFENFPPEIPDTDNPTGVYRRTFTVPDDWRARRTVLRFDGVENFFIVFLNGEEIGFAKNSRGMSEFDLTDRLKTGENELAVLVSQFAESSFIEDQDQWWHGGIFRSVSLLSEPPEHIEDAFVRATLDDTLANGVLKVTLTAALTLKPDLLPKIREGLREWEPRTHADGWTFAVKLYDGKKRLAETSGKLTEEVGDVSISRQNNIRRYVSGCELAVPGIRPWSAEDPYRYTVLVSLLEHGKVRDVVRVRTGFRRVEVKHRQLLVNGKRVPILGVNRHEHHPRTGRTLTLDDMRRDLELMKQFNVNAVRTSHYPDAPEFYDLCDEYGIYVFDEANIECHAFFADLCRDPQWHAEFLSRAVDLVERDKNHPSVIVWSLGNESGFGENQAAACGWIRKFDPDRPLLCERATTDVKRSLAPMRHRAYTDIVAPMYRPPHEIRHWADCAMEEDRPLILCEYSHAMGNSSGGLADYFREFRSHNGLQGGFIWEWCDHGILKKNADGTEFFAYGGDFGEPYHDGNFVTDGLVSPDRVPHPGLYEFKKLAQPAEIRLLHPGTRQIMLVNRRCFTGLGDCRIEWELAVDGRPVATGTAPVPELAPDGFIPNETKPFGRSVFDRKLGNEAVVMLDYEIPRDLASGSVCTLTVRLVLKQNCLWAPAGHVVAHEQFVLPVLPSRPAAFPSAKPLPAKLRNVFAQGRLHLWRATTDNDAIRQHFLLNAKSSRAAARWLALGLDKAVGVREKGRTVYHLTEGRFVAHAMTLEEDGGALYCRNRIEVGPGVTDLPRIGLVFELPREFMRAEYFGLGPFENYCDRLAAATLGRWHLAADDPCPYIVPQEYGNRTGVRELTLFGKGRALRIVPDLPMECSLRQYDEKAMQYARHWHDVPAAPVNYLSLDLCQRGVGTGSCGPDTFDAYRTLDSGIYEFSFRVVME